MTLLTLRSLNLGNLERKLGALIQQRLQLLIERINLVAYAF
jgi:hypothetical protein